MNPTDKINHRMVRKTGLLASVFCLLVMMGPATSGLVEPEQSLIELPDLNGLLPILSGTELWDSRHNGPAGGNDRANAIAVHPSGLLTYVTGTVQASSSEYQTIAYEALTGLPLWEARYDGPSALQDEGHDLVVDPTGQQVYVTGISRSNTGFGIATIAYNALTGLEAWTARHDGVGTWAQTAAIDVAPDGETVYVTGTIGSMSNSHFATLAYDTATGDELWRATYVGSAGGGDEAQDIVVSPDGSKVFITGWSIDLTTTWDYATVAYDAETGTELWVSRYSGPAGDMDFPRAIGVDPSGDRVYVTGGGMGIGTSFDVATVAYDAQNGQELWVERYNGPAGNSDSAWDLAVGPDGNVYINGFSWGVGTGLDSITIAYDGESGEMLWENRYNGPNNASDFGEAITVSADGSQVFATGYSLGPGSGFDYATVAYDAQSGQEQWVERYDGPVGGNDFPSDIAVDPLGLRVYITGRSQGVDSVEFATVAYLSR